MRSSQRYSAEDNAASLILLRKLVSRLRRSGLRVSTSEVIDAHRLLKTYSALNNGSLGPDDVIRVAKAVFVKHVEDEELFQRTVEELIAEKNAGRRRSSLLGRVEEDLRKLGIRYGEVIKSKKSLLYSRKKSERRELLSAYGELRRLGIIRRTRGRERVVSRSEALRIISGIPGGSSTAMFVEDMVHGYIPEPELLRDVYLDETQLSRIPVKNLPRIGLNALKAGNRVLALSIARMLEERLHRGEAPGNIEEAYRLFTETGLGFNAKALLLRHDPRIADQLAREFGAERILDFLARSEPELLSRVIGRLSRVLEPIQIEKAISYMPLKAIAGIPRSVSKKLRPDARKLVEAARSLVAAEESIVAYYETGNEGRIDMAVNEYMKAMKLLGTLTGQRDIHSALLGKLRGKAFAIGETLSGGIRSIEPLVRRLNISDALRLLGAISRNSRDERMRRKALRLARRLWRIRMSRVRSLRLVRWRNNLRHGRIDLRRSIYRAISYRSPPLSYRSRERERGIVLVIDRSGSMYDYATRALLVASALSPAVKRIILFSEDVEILEGGLLRNPVDLLLTTRFSGYTNLSAALRTAAKGLPPGTMIIISDLKQTVNSESPDKVALELRKKGWRLIVAAPQRMDRTTAHRLSRLGVKIIALRRPEDTIRFLSRII